LAPYHKVLCHSRSPFMTTVTLVGVVGDRLPDWGDAVRLWAGLGAGGLGATGWSLAQPDSMINSAIATAANRTDGLRNEPSRTRQPP
jgi:hypothetical protein